MSPAKSAGRRRPRRIRQLAEKAGQGAKTIRLILALGFRYYSYTPRAAIFGGLMRYL